MNLIYIDESGNTGLNLKDSQQPVFLLAALILHSSKWFDLEKKFYEILSAYCGQNAYQTELHAINLKTRRGPFSALTAQQAIDLRDRLLDLLLTFQIPVIYQRVRKSKFEEFCRQNYGAAIKIQPYIMSLPFLCVALDAFLASQSPKELGMLIFDEQKEYFTHIEQSLHTLRINPNSILKTTCIIEKGFFVDSIKCFAIQLTDLVAHYLRKQEEQQMGLKINAIDATALEAVSKIGKRAVCSNTSDILEWVKINFAG